MSISARRRKLPRALSGDQIAFYRDTGYLVVPGLLSAREIDDIRDVFTAEAANGPVPGLSDSGYAFVENDPLARWPRMMHPHRHWDRGVGSCALRYLLDPRIGDVLRDLFDDEPLAAQSMFYFKPPGARGQDLHQDNFYLRVRPGTCAAAWIAIDGADRENGGLVVVPGSNRLDVLCPKPADSSTYFTRDHVDVPEGMHEVPVDLSAGDALFFHGSLIHGSPPNGSRDRFRRALIFHYIPRSSAEVSGFYQPLLSFDGTETERDRASGGGPCGTAHAAGDKAAL